MKSGAEHLRDMQTREEWRRLKIRGWLVLASAPFVLGCVWFAVQMIRTDDWRSGIACLGCALANETLLRISDRYR